MELHCDTSAWQVFRDLLITIDRCRRSLDFLVLDTPAPGLIQPTGSLPCEEEVIAVGFAHWGGEWGPHEMTGTSRVGCSDPACIAALVLRTPRTSTPRR